LDKTPPEDLAAEAQIPRNLARQGGIVAGMTLLSRISGLVRDIFFSYLLGASQFADMFYVAFRIPNFFRRLFAEGAFSQAFVPVLMRYKEQGVDEVRLFLAPLSGLFGSALVLLVALGLLFAEELTYVFAPGFSELQQQSTASLVFIMFPYIGFISLTAYAGALLNAHDRFAVPAVTPVLLNLSLIGASLVALAGWSDLPQVDVLAWGVLAAGVVQLLFQVPFIVKIGALPAPRFNYRHEGVRRVGRLLLPAVFAGSVGQINALVNTVLASMLITGSVSWLYYADRLLELPVGLVAIALGTVLLPHLSRLATDEDQVQFKRALSWGIGLGLFMGLPAAVALYLLADALVATVFMSIAGGAMTPYDVRMAGLGLQMFALALPGFVLVRVLAPAFYAHEDTHSPFRFAAYSVVANLLVSLATFSWFGHVGLAWATAVAAWVNVVGLYTGLSRRRIYSLQRSVTVPVLRTGLASLCLGLGLYYLTSDIAWFEMQEGLRIVVVGLVCVGGLIGYIGVQLLFGWRFEEINHYSGTQAE